MVAFGESLHFSEPRPPPRYPSVLLGCVRDTRLQIGMCVMSWRVGHGCRCLAVALALGPFRAGRTPGSPPPAWCTCAGGIAVWTGEEAVVDQGGSSQEAQPLGPAGRTAPSSARSIKVPAGPYSPDRARPQGGKISWRPEETRHLTVTGTHGLGCGGSGQDHPPYLEISA